MRQVRAALILCTILSTLTFEDVAAQTPLLPSSVGVDLGIGASFPKCPRSGLPLWTARCWRSSVGLGSPPFHPASSHRFDIRQRGRGELR